MQGSFFSTEKTRTAQLPVVISSQPHSPNSVILHCSGRFAVSPAVNNAKAMLYLYFTVQHEHVGLCMIYCGE